MWRGKTKALLRINEFPEHLSSFMQTIEIKEDMDDPKERARRAAEKRKQKEREALNNTKITPVSREGFLDCFFMKQLNDSSWSPH